MLLKVCLYGKTLQVVLNFQSRQVGPCCEMSILTNSAADTKRTSFTCNQINIMSLITTWCTKWRHPRPSKGPSSSRSHSGYDSAISILGQQIDSRLICTFHVRVKGKVRNAARKLSCIHCITPLLKVKGCYTLYHSQARSIIEHCPLVWSCCPPPYLGLLERV